MLMKLVRTEGGHVQLGTASHAVDPSNSRDFSQETDVLPCAPGFDVRDRRGIKTFKPAPLMASGWCLAPRRQTVRLYALPSA
jgi:hypothetical protein